MTKKTKILQIISLIRESHPWMSKIYTEGSCLNFHLILRAIFPEAQPYYDMDHIITKIDNTYYDINGIYLNHKNHRPYTGRGFSQMMNYFYNPQVIQ